LESFFIGTLPVDWAAPLHRRPPRRLGSDPPKVPKGRVMLLGLPLG